MRRVVSLLCLAVPLVAVGVGLRHDWADVAALSKDFWLLVAPGGKLHPAAFLEHKGHLVVETLLIAAILYLVFLPRAKPKHKETLTQREVEELCREWKPEPLVPIDFEETDDREIVIDSKVDRMVCVNGRELLNMDCTDFLGLLSCPQIEEACRSCIDTYGVGSCGPRAFYGTTAVHLKLEEHIAQFLNVQETIVYSFDLATVPSVIPAFANKKDVIVVDDAVHYAIQSGCQLSRAQVKPFRHNDMDDLERVLKQVDEQHRRARKPLNRRLIVVEGIYQDRGDIAPLDQIYRLKEKYKYRLIVDESLAIGVLGKTGRGACEAFGFEPGQIDLVVASLSNAMASTGGFCAGNRDVVGHQRLNGNGYIFSASLPPFLAAAADEALTQLRGNLAAMAQLRENAAYLRRELARIAGLTLIGGENTTSPVLHLQLSGEEDDAEARGKLTHIVDRVRDEDGIVLSVPTFTGLEWKIPKPTLRVVVTAKHTKDDLIRVRDAVRKAAQEVV